MDVLKYKIGCGNKTKITFRLNKNSPISSSVALGWLKKDLCKTLNMCASTHLEINLVEIKAQQKRVHKNDPFTALLFIRVRSTKISQKVVKTFHIR